MDTETEVARIKEALGVSRIAAAVGVVVSAVSNCKDRFPAHWFMALSELCEAEGLECDRRLFRWAKAKPAQKTETGTKTGATL